MKLTILALITAVALPVYAAPGGESGNTNCNGVGNPNSPCEGNNGGSQGSGSNSDYGYSVVTNTLKTSSKTTNNLVNTIDMQQNQAQNQWQGQKQAAVGVGLGGSSSARGGYATASGGSSDQTQSAHGGAGYGGNGYGGAGYGGASKSVNEGNHQQIVVEGSRYEAPDIPVNSSIATVGITTASCYVSGGGAGNTGAVSISISGAIKDEDCEWRVKQAYRLTYGNERTIEIAHKLIEMDAEEDYAKAVAKQAERKNTKKVSGNSLGLDFDY